MTKRQVKQLSYDITGYAIKVHKALGPGLLESVYEKCLKFELERNGHHVIQQAIVPVEYDGLELDIDLKVDLYVDNCIVVELKTVENILPIHEAQILTYMKLLCAPQGLIINFYTDNITKSLKPFVSNFYNILKD
ncbi:GxxExxY protein [Pedobacter lithocola]|uniref:GxxExxY protein n=1 Tax=Pedobacter lithocola TaxID=1908239 RepID=A0ABV8PCU9_9SPHI